MQQEYRPYWEWEDYHNGMWRKLKKADEARFLRMAIEFTGDHNKYGSAMSEVSVEWPCTMANSLTNPSINKRAFVGHCACAFKINCPEYITRMAWKELTNQQRVLADAVAQKTIDLWVLRYKEKLKNTSPHGNEGAIQMEYQMTLQLS